MGTQSRDMPSSGTVIGGRYQVQDVLGRGGFGVVYRGLQLNTGQTVAIKVLQSDAARDLREASIERQRFEREMRTIAQLNHPNVVRLIDSGLTDEGRLYTVLEFIQGETLAALLQREGALHPVEAKYLMMQVLDALACAHGKGIVHRDLKPHNIMVTSTGARRNALVLDFGIATVLEERQSSDFVALTGDGRINGTPAYMAPEQFGPNRPTQQVDIYAWGLVFLECLTGIRAIQGESLGEYLMKQISPEPIALPAAYGNHPLVGVLQRSTAKRPEERYQQVTEVLYELDRVVVEDLPLVVPIVGARDRAPALRTGGVLTPTTGRSGVISLAAQPLPGAALALPAPPPQQQRRGFLLGVIATLTVLLALVAAGLWIARLMGSEPSRDEASDRATPREPAATAEVDVASSTADAAPTIAVAAVADTAQAEDRGAAELPDLAPTTTTVAENLVQVPAFSTEIGLSEAEMSEQRKWYADNAFDLSYETAVLRPRNVELAELEVDATEVSRQLWNDVLSRSGDATLRTVCSEPPAPVKSNDEPVTRLGAAEAEAFCRLRGMRLPTSEEWEALARGKERRDFGFVGEMTEQRANELAGGARVADAWNHTPEGVVALSGGVREWVRCTDGAYCTEGFGLRGGSYLSASSFWWLASVQGLPPDESPSCFRAVDVGFRCVRARGEKP